MASNKLQSVLALECLRAPLDPYQANVNQEDFLTNMRIKFRTYYLEYNSDNGAIMLPTLFARDFGDEVPRVVLLVDAHNNQSEILVEKINGNIYFTRGWTSLRDFYDISMGGWLVLAYTGFGRFGVTVYDAIKQEVVPPTFQPPMRLVIHTLDIPPHFVNDIPDSIDSLAYAHDPDFFNFECEKTLTYYDVTNGFLVLPYDGFGEFVFDQSTTSVKIVDDCGNVWNCMLIFVSFPWKHFKLGNEWSRLVGARKLAIGTDITIGAETVDTETLYLSVEYP